MVYTLCISEDFEVLDAILTFDWERKISGRALADADDESALVLVGQQLLRVRARDSTVVPRVRFHLDVVAGDQTWNNYL